jgi:two-component system osmolarity sensor histidine kinase EnvZ
VGSALVFVLWPMAQRSADDLAGLMVLSAQTWAELPPATRPAFEEELVTTHQLALRPGPLASPPDALVHGFYIAFLERALERRIGPATLYTEPGPDGSRWLWTEVPAGGRRISVGFDTERLDTHPLIALLLVLLLGGAAVALTAVWLARRIAEPVERLEQAAADLAHGHRPKLLPEVGPLELARLAGHFNHLALQLRDLLDARTTLFAGVSHDLRTPLARMRLALEMLTLRPDAALIGRMVRDIEEMNALIGQMLDLARGLDQEAAQDVHLAPWLQARVQAHLGLAQAAGASLAVDCEPGLRLRVAAGSLGRVLDNLIGNALRYAPGPVTLTARRVADPAGAPRVRLAVLDRGPGIPEVQRELMWRPFQRGETSRSPQTGGYGLGLAIVRRLATLQGWQVGLELREGGGLEAWVELPGER